MKRFVKYVLTVVIFTGWMGAAQASLIFDFTFTNSANGGGVVIGEILGLENNSSGMASGHPQQPSLYQILVYQEVCRVRHRQLNRFA